MNVNKLGIKARNEQKRAPHIPKAIRKQQHIGRSTLFRAGLQRREGHRSGLITNSERKWCVISVQPSRKAYQQISNRTLQRKAGASREDEGRLLQGEQPTRKGPSKRRPTSYTVVGPKHGEVKNVSPRADIACNQRNAQHGIQKRGGVGMGG